MITGQGKERRRRAATAVTKATVLLLGKDYTAKLKT